METNTNDEIVFGNKAPRKISADKQKRIMENYLANKDDILLITKSLEV